MAIMEEIIKLMEGKKYKPLLKEELAARFNVGKGEQKEFFKILDAMEKEGVILKARDLGLSCQRTDRERIFSFQQIQ